MTNLTEMQLEEVLEVFKNNNDFQSRVWADAMESDAYYNTEEMLNYFYHTRPDGRGKRCSLRSYSIDYSGAFIIADVTREVLEDMAAVNADYSVFDEALTGRLARALEKIDLYIDVTEGYEDMSDSRFYHLENFMQNVKNSACNKLAEFMQGCYTAFDDYDFLEEYFVDFWLETYGEDFSVDESGAVYETITTVKKYV